MRKIINREELNSVINNGSVCLKFGAEWCGPCSALTELIEENEGNYKDVNFIEIDVDEFDDEAIFDEYNIKNIPVLYFIKDGLINNKTVGLISKDDLNNFITKLINS